MATVVMAMPAVVDDVALILCTGAPSLSRSSKQPFHMITSSDLVIPYLHSITTYPMLFLLCLACSSGVDESIHVAQMPRSITNHSNHHPYHTIPCSIVEAYE
jgi:hypothetical protein